MNIKIPVKKIIIEVPKSGWINTKRNEDRSRRDEITKSLNISSLLFILAL